MLKCVFNLQNLLHLLAMYIPAKIFLLTTEPYVSLEGPWTLNLSEQIEGEREHEAAAAFYEVQ